jgi:hypothetical protein
MTKVYKSARGKMIDIDRIKLANETVNAVGNMRVNARGDIVGANGQIEMGRNQIMDQAYAVADAPYSPNDPEVFNQQQKLIENNKAQELYNMVNNLTQSSTVEPMATEPVPSARGTLAAAAAKTVSVVQQAAPTAQEQKKAQGPTRI